MNIVFIASECHPFAKTGGLADVVGSLPIALKKLGHNTIVILPKYRSIDVNKYNLVKYQDLLGVWMGNTLEWCSVWKSSLPEDVPVYFIEFDSYFNREGFYCDNHMNDYLDNPKRFCFLTRAALQFCIDNKIKVDIFNFHDWQTAAGTCYQKTWHWNNEYIGQAATILTIHNIGYQGKYSANDYDYLGLGWENFHNMAFEDFGGINLLKGGIYFADMVNTVSPTYAKETLTELGSFGLHTFLQRKHDNYVGILNGVDYEHWNPETDPYIPCHYNINNIENKTLNKKVLQETFLLEINENIPIIGIVSRFAQQKGLHLLFGTIERILENMIVQFAILGSGDKGLEGYFGYLPSKYPGKIGSYIGYNERLAHLIEAGSDFFLMPSIYEPCGLNQIYSLKYGTLPIVRATGGLEDTVIQYDEQTGYGTGFKFYNIDSNAIYYTVGWAVSTYYDRKEHFHKMRQLAMEQDFSWEKSANEYLKLYKKAIENRNK
ncbi:MAG TPA: glycogen synthase [Ignavibacteriales bacterium]|nr:glycogen synthase [Ignavibacteriales bacterium]